MPTPPVSRQQAREAVSFVNKALKQGFKLKGAPSAIEEAARTFRAETGVPLNRQAFRQRVQAAEFRYGILPRATKKQTAEPAAATPSAEDHAHARARSLSEEITRLVTRSRYPLVNPDAILVESYLSRRYDRNIGKHVVVEGTPRTWLSGTLQVAPVAKPKGRKFLFTGAQNDAPIHEAFWANLQAYAAHIGAEIVVGPWTYETQWWSENNPTSRAYDTALSDHLCFGQMPVSDHFVFCGEMNTLPTAARPISDLVTYSRGRWAVFPHAKLQLKSVPSTDPRIQAHQVMTSGAVTRPKVIPRKAGVKSIFHHIIGATIVEFDRDGDIFCRQINANDADGSFYDLDVFASKGNVTAGHRVRSIVTGDIHCAKLRPRNTIATFGYDPHTGKIVRDVSLLDTLRPELVFLHDIFDMQARNHHHVGDNAYSYEQAVRKKESVLGEIAGVADFLKAISRPWLRPIVVESNHDLALERYVREGRYRNDGENIRIGIQLEDAYLAYREQVAHALDRYESPPTFSVLEHAIRKFWGDDIGNVEWVHDGQSFIVDGVECGHHGFRGTNGAKATINTFARIGRKITFADKHTAEIMDAAYCVGAMELQHGYNKGPSSWTVSDCVQYPNGKRTLLTMQNGKWRG
jgi:hypothetical protein